MPATSTRFCVFLRGINVGGKYPLKMAELRSRLSESGFEDVVTYIQSGNILASAKLSADAVAKAIQDIIQQHWKYDVQVAVIKAGDLVKIVEANPLDDVDPTHLAVTFLKKPAPAAQVRQLGVALTGDERLEPGRRVIYLYLPHGSAKTKLNNNFIEQKLGQPATTRNWRTVNKMCDLLNG